MAKNGAGSLSLSISLLPCDGFDGSLIPSEQSAVVIDVPMLNAADLGAKVIEPLLRVLADLDSSDHIFTQLSFDLFAKLGQPVALLYHLVRGGAIHRR